MKKSYIYRNIKNQRRFLLICFAVTFISAVILTLALSGASSIAFADDEITPPAKDTFSVVFPTVSYLQSDNPTLIAANDLYLIVYDERACALFAMKNGSDYTYAYPIELENVQYIKAVGNTAFIYANKECYTLDLKDTTSKPVKRELTSPQDANYFRSDGKYLYAKSSYGFISVYDENLEIALGIDNHVYIDNTYASVFAGMQPLAGENGLFYYFPDIFGSRNYIVYDPLTKSELFRKKNIGCSVSEAYVGEIIYAQVNTGALIGLDKATGDILFSSDIIPNSFCASGNMLFTVEGKQIVTYSLEKSEEGKYIGFKKESTISMAGSDDSHLNGPSDVVKFDGKLVVADTLNKRLGFIDSASLMTTISMDSAPLRLATDSTGVYALTDKYKIVKYEGEQITQTYNVEDVIDIAYLDKLYILKSDGLYTALAGGIYKLSDVVGAKNVACAKDGTNVYVLTKDSIMVLAKDGTLLGTMPCEFEDSVDFAVDYAGQITVLFSDRIENYTNTVGTLKFASKTEFYSATAHAHANALCLDSNSAYFTAEECLIGMTSVDAATKDTYDSNELYAPIGNESYHFAKLKEDVRSYIIPIDGRMENISSAPSDTLIVLDSVECIADNLAYALLKGNLFIIAKDDYDKVQTEELSGNYVAICDTTIYSLPDVDGGKLDIEEGTKFTMFADCADYDGSQWVRINYEEGVYFIKAEDCEEYKFVIPEEEKTFGKAKAKRVGGLVNIYTEANVNSPAVKEIVDGTEVEVLEEVDGFYLVRHGEDIGYMLKEEVKIGGLTTVQIVSIVLAVFVVIAGGCIFAAIQLTKKKADEDMRKRKD